MAIGQLCFMKWLDTVQAWNFRDPDRFMARRSFNYDENVPLIISFATQAASDFINLDAVWYCFFPSVHKDALISGVPNLPKYKIIALLQRK